MRNRYIYITLLSILGFNAETYAQVIVQAPRLVVSITIDQLRTDYLETYAPLYSNDGLKRLLTDGKVFINGAYNFTPVDRASAIASLHTGTVPYYNGITAEEWLDKQTLRPQNCVRDQKIGYSPQFLGTSTISDELKMATNGVAKVFSFAPTADAAILSAGHAADGAAWVSNGKWATTTYYRPINQWLSGYTRLFLPGTDVNKAVTDAALKCLEQAGVGNDDKTDLLSLTYEAGRQMESYVELDRQMALLLNGIERQIARDRVLFVITGTSSREEEEESNQERYRIPTGTFYINRTANLLNMYLGAIFGSAKYVEFCHKNHIYFNHQLLRQKNIHLGEICSRSQEFLLQLSGVRNVYTANQLLTSDSYLLESIRNGFNVEKCGDLIIDIAPGWKLINEDTLEKSISRSAHVPFPIIIYGAGTKAERIQTPVTVDRIAPAVARAIRIRAPNACSSEPLF
ncbi:MAG: alkaline phosphatase family protein [Prevotella sp.]|nr:alkaline phosphatase family protein [Prevotella sp.]